MGRPLAAALGVLVLLLAPSVHAEVDLSPTPSPAPTWTATPEATEVARAAPASRGGRREDWRTLLENYPWDADQAARVVMCESRGRADAWNTAGSGARGLFQTMGQWAGLAYALTGSSDLLDPAVNVAVAFYLWRDSGGSFWPHWAASAGCWR